MNKDTQPQNPGRRKLLAGAAAVSATLATSQAFAASEHDHHHAPAANNGVIDAALDCLKTGEACKTHCLHLVKGGDTTIADCLSSVNDMLPMCDALAKLAASQSPHLAGLARVCIDVCRDCAKECKVHKDKHPECKACMESCLACIKACEKIAA